MKEAALREATCLVPVCGATWDSTECPACGFRDEASEEPTCSRCGRSWDPAACPACGGSNFHVPTLAELLYPSDGLYCRACRTVWRPAGPDEDERCPECGSEDLAESYPEIPDLSEIPGLALVFAAESRIPRAENGAMLHREMVSWLRFHGVRRRADLMQIETWFDAIGSVRARAIEELTDTTVKKKDEDAED